MKTTVHDAHAQARARRFAQGVYGEVKSPHIPQGEPVCYSPVSYLESRRTCDKIKHQIRDRMDRKLDLRCFFTGVQLTPAPAHNQGPAWCADPKLNPWMGTRDHLVPARRNVKNQPQVYHNYNSSLVWCGNMVNVTLGLAPLMVRLKIRQWLQTVRIPRQSPSAQDTENLRWLLIHYMDHFRINGRYPWSRNSLGAWWYPEYSEPFMHRMWNLEEQFLQMSDVDRDAWINKFQWQF